MERTTLDFEYKGKEYSLAYTIDLLKRMDKSGTLSAIANGERPLTMTEDLFIAAFEANHASVPHSTREAIFRELEEVSEDGSLLEVLLGMVNEVREAMVPKGNVKWRASKGN